MGEWYSVATSWSLTFSKSKRPYFTSLFWFLTYTDSLNFRGVYKWVYCIPCDIFKAGSKIPSSTEMISKYLWNKLTVHVLIRALNLAFNPLGLAPAIILPVYPIPAFAILTSTNLPPLITGTIFP